MSDVTAMGGTSGMGAAAAKQAELVQFKVRMDGLKQRLTDGPGEQEQLQKACRDFEAVFIGKLWEQMEKTVPQEGYLHSKQEGMYKSMFSKEFSESMADAGGIGLADMLYDQLAQRLKQVSADTLAANSEIKPLSQNGKPDMKNLQEMQDSQSRLNGSERMGVEPSAPQEIVPESMGPSSTEPVGGYDMENKAASIVQTQPMPPVRDVSSLTRPQVDAELNELARNMRFGTVQASVLEPEHEEG